MPRVWTYEAGLVGHHHALDAVAKVEFGQDARDVGLDGGFSEVQLGRDLGVRQSPCDCPQDVEFARRQLM